MALEVVELWSADLHDLAEAFEQHCLLGETVNDGRALVVQRAEADHPVVAGPPQFGVAAGELDDVGGVTHALRGLLKWPNQQPSATGRLTARQLQVVALLADGLRYRDIAACLSISERQVQRHVGNAIGRLDVDSTAELVAVAVAEGIVPDCSS